MNFFVDIFVAQNFFHFQSNLKQKTQNTRDTIVHNEYLDDTVCIVPKSHSEMRLSHFIKMYRYALAFAVNNYTNNIHSA